MERVDKLSGFTLVEILIAIMVVSFGLLGLFAVFPSGMRDTADIAKDSYAAMIAESVKSSVEFGLLKNYVELHNSAGFVYTGEGVELLLERAGKKLPVNNRRIDTTAPYWVKLPRGEEQLFVYPRHDPSKFQTLCPDMEKESPGDYVRKTFPLGYDVIKAREGIDPDNASRTLQRAEIREAGKDPYPRYSYAFAIREAKIDTDNDPERRPDNFSPTHSLYEITIYIYRNFPQRKFDSGNIQAGHNDRNSKPIRTFKSLISA